MSFHSRSFHRTLAPVFLLTALLSPLSLAAWPATAPYGESIELFVRHAYAGVGISPSCSQVRFENAILEDLLPNTSSQFEAEARRFVSTLVETQYSYTNYGPEQSPYFEETSYYSSRNPVPTCPAHDGNEDFVIDLYHAFLQREYDTSGLSFWKGVADECTVNAYRQRKVVLNAFGTIPDDAEFTDLVNSLVDYGAVCCPTHCPPNTVYDCEVGHCVSD